MPLGASYKLADGEQLLGESDDTSGPWGNGTSIPDWDTPLVAVDHDAPAGGHQHPPHPHRNMAFTMLGGDMPMSAMQMPDEESGDADPPGGGGGIMTGILNLDMDDDVPPDQSQEAAAAEYERVLVMAGTGRFHWFLLLALGFPLASCAMSLLSISFVITSTAECDLDLTNSHKGALNAVVFAGMLAGGYTLGASSDRFGRKKSLLCTLTITGIVTLVSSFLSNFWGFLVLRLVAGTGIGGALPVIFPYISEFLASEQRGLFMSLLAGFWTAGNLLVAGLAWGLLTINSCHELAENFDTIDELCDALEPGCGQVELAWGETAIWRVYMAVVGLVPLICVPMLWFLVPESPKWQISHGQTEQANKTLQRIATRHKRDVSLLAKEFVELCSVAEMQRAVESKRESEAQRARFTTLKRTILLFRAKGLRKNALLLLAIWWTLSFSFYGLFLWLPSYFKNIGIGASGNIYATSFYVAVSTIPGTLVSSWTVGRFGRKWTLLPSLAISGGCVFLLFAITSAGGTTAFSCLFSGLSTGAWAALNILSTELFPAHMRGTAFGTFSAFGRFGAIMGTLIFGIVSDSDIATPLILVGVSLGISATASLFLPNHAPIVTLLLD